MVCRIALYWMFLAAGLSSEATAQTRAWTDRSGRFTIEAKLISVSPQGVVLLEHPDGRRVQIAFSRLSTGDQRHLRELAAAQKKSGSAQPPTPESRLRVGAPPARLQTPAFYKKHLDYRGVPILASAKVSDDALRHVHKSLNLLLSKRQDVIRALAGSRVWIVIIAPDEKLTEVPENAKLTPKEYWDTKTRSISASTDRPVMTVSEENVLGRQDDAYQGESLLVHELAHTVHEMALNRLDPKFEPKLKELFQSATQRGLWKSTFAGRNYREYWAEGVQSWLGVNREAPQPDGVHNSINTRAELQSYDRDLARLISTVFP